MVEVPPWNGQGRLSFKLSYKSLPNRMPIKGAHPNFRRLVDYSRWKITHTAPVGALYYSQPSAGYLYVR